MKLFFGASYRHHYVQIKNAIELWVPSYPIWTPFIRSCFNFFLVYALLFSNILFTCTACLSTLMVAIFDDSFSTWMIVFVLASQSSQLYHVVCWSVVSILRYLYIIESAWLFNKFPDQKKLMVCIAGIFKPNKINFK